MRVTMSDGAEKLLRQIIAGEKDMEAPCVRIRRFFPGCGV